MNYEEDVEIDPSSLDVEWLGQSSLAMRYGKHYAQCKKVLTQAEENIKIIRAELIKKANTDSDRYLGIGVKPTGPVVESYYRNHKRHKEAKEQWIEAQYECNMAEIAKNEISFTRKSALENLVKLHGQQYFAGPSIPRDLNYEWEQHENQKKSNEKVTLKRR